MKPFILYSLLFILLFAVAAPLAASAHTPDIFPTGYWGKGGLISCKGLECQSIDDLTHTFIHFIYFGMTVALFLFAPLFFAWGGLMILIAGGSQEKLGSGKKILTGTVWGVVIVLIAYLIVRTFVSALFGSSGVGQFGL